MSFIEYLDGEIIDKNECDDSYYVGYVQAMHNAKQIFLEFQKENREKFLSMLIYELEGYDIYEEGAPRGGLADHVTETKEVADCILNATIEKKLI
jgi:hypothetical protein